eukprot:1355888-Amphidinium_carterae.1
MPLRPPLFAVAQCRAAYLGQDRVDIAETVKCLACAMAKPHEGRMAQLNKVAHYLKGVPWCARRHTMQSAACGSKTLASE